MPLVQTKFGLVPKESALHTSRQLSTRTEVPIQTVSMPKFDLPILSFPVTVLFEKQNLHFDSLSITAKQSTRV